MAQKPVEPTKVVEPTPEPLTTVSEVSNPASTVTKPADVIGFPFGNPVFTVPKNDRESRFGGRLLADVQVPVPSLGLLINTGVWYSEEDQKDGTVRCTYSVSMPRQLVADDAHDYGKQTVDLFRAHCLDRFWQWQSDPVINAKLFAPKVSPRASGRLVFTKPAPGVKPVNPAVVQTGTDKPTI